MEQYNFIKQSKLLVEEKLLGILPDNYLFWFRIKYNKKSSII